MALRTCNEYRSSSKESLLGPPAPQHVGGFYVEWWALTLPGVLSGRTLRNSRKYRMDILILVALFLCVLGLALFLDARR